MSNLPKPAKDSWAQGRVNAVHYIDRAKFKGGEILCDFELPTIAAVWRDRTTEDLRSVTCKECKHLLQQSGRLGR